LIGGLTPGAEHHFHVHQAGNISDTASATATLGHFVGDCVNCRPGYPAKIQEVGQIGNGYALVVATNTTLIGSFYDSLPQMRGLRSIVGRSIVGAPSFEIKCIS
jgi:Cu/Zn superoxide dismutase